VVPVNGVGLLSVDEAQQMLGELRREARHHGGYRREPFGDGWATLEGCTVRQWVLAEEMVTGEVEGCWIEDGRWRDWYGPGRSLIAAGAVQLDHVVPLAQAWQAGAHRWPARRRRALDNDLSSPLTLTAVSAVVNEAKGASPPDVWLPPDRRSHCRYAITWIAIKHRWELSITDAEPRAFAGLLERCP